MEQEVLVEKEGVNPAKSLFTAGVNSGAKSLKKLISQCAVKEFTLMWDICRAENPKKKKKRKETYKLTLEK